MKEHSFIVGDAGGTGTQWRIVRGGGISQFTTVGFNAYTHNIDELIRDIHDRIGAELNGISNIYLYAAGVNVPSQKKETEEKLSNVFDATPKVENDLLGVARSLCGTDPGNVCILGTGANACYYNGESVDKVGASLGYVLGDEGSGAYLGKKFLTKVFRAQMDQSIIENFNEAFDLTSHNVIETLYNQPKPNHFLASFANFIAGHKNHPDVYRLIYSAFEDFFNAFFLAGSDGEFHFSGSIAYYFSDILRQVGIDMDFQIKNIVESPIAGLVLYHKENG